MTIGENIKAIRQQKGISQKDIADKIGVTYQNISQYERGVRSPKMETLRKIADALGVDVWEIIGFNEMLYTPSSCLEKPSNVNPLSDLYHQRIPLIGKVAAGQPIMAEEEYDTFVDAPIDCDCALEVQGESMVPTYLPGDIVYIKHRQTVNDGQIAVVLVDDEATLKHVYFDNAGLTLISDNPAFAPIRINGQDHEYLAIYGIPVGYTRMFKKNKSNQ